QSPPAPSRSPYTTLFRSPFPVLEMQFADTRGRQVASRRFRPEEYLSGELAGVRLMPPQTPIHIGLSMLDPGTQAHSYRLEFLSRSEEHTSELQSREKHVC